MTNKIKLGMIDDIDKSLLYFKATKDLKWLIKAAEVEKLKKDLYHAKPSHVLEPVTISDFKNTLLQLKSKEPSDTVDDLLNEITCDALLDFYSDLDDTKSAINSIRPSNIDTGLKSSLLPFSEVNFEKIQSIALALFGALEGISPELISKAKSKIEDDKTFKNGLRYVLTMAYIYTLQDILVKNPILAIVPSEFLSLKKDAGLISEAALDPLGPRLNDLIDALKIIRGRLVLQFNKYSLQDRSDQIPGLKSVLEVESNRKIAAALNSCARLIATVTSYIEFYTRMQNQLKALLEKNPEFKNLKDPITNENINENPYISSSKYDPMSGQIPSSINKILANHEMFKNLNLELEDWSGKKQRVTQINHSQSDIIGSYFKDVVDKPGYSKKIATDLIKDSDMAIVNYEAISRMPMVAKLSSILLPSKSTNADKIYADIISTLKAAGKSTESNESLIELADKESDELLVPLNSNSVSMRKYDKEVAANMISAFTELFDRYKGSVQNASDLKKFITDVMHDFAWPISPYTKRYLKKQTYGFPLMTEKGISDHANVSSKALAGYLGEVFSSPTFRRRALSNRDEYEQEKKVRENDYIKSVAEGLEALTANEKLLTLLDIDPASFDYTPPTGSTEKEIGKNISNLFQKKMSILLSKSPEELRNIFDNNGGKDIPLDSLYTYLGRRYQATIGPYLQDQLKYIRTGGDVSAQNKKELDVSKYFSEYFNRLQPKMNKHQQVIPDLNARTAAGMIKSWHQDNKLGASEERRSKQADYPRKGNIPFLNYMRNNASLGLGSWIQTENQRNINSILKENAADRSVTDDNWDNPTNLRPRNLKELAHVVGAFADPVPKIFPSGARRTAMMGMPLLKKNLEPGELVDPSESKYADTPYEHLRRLYSEAGTSLGDNGMPIEQLRDMFAYRRREIEELPVVGKEYAKYLKVYKYSPKNSIYESPFIEGEAVEEGQVSTYSKDEALKFIGSLVGAPGISNGDIRELRERIRIIPEESTNFFNIETFSKVLAAQMSDWSNEKRVVVLDKLIPGQGSAIAQTQQTLFIERAKQEADKIISVFKSTNYNMGDLDTVDSLLKYGSSIEDLILKVKKAGSTIAILLKQGKPAGSTIRRTTPVQESSPAAPSANPVTAELAGYLLKLTEATAFLDKVYEEYKKRLAELKNLKTIQDSAAKLFDKIQEFKRLMTEAGYDEPTQGKVVAILTSLTTATNSQDLIAPNQVGRLIRDLENAIFKKWPLDDILNKVDSYRLKNTVEPFYQEEEDESREESEFENIFESEAAEEESLLADDGYYYL